MDPNLGDPNDAIHVWCNLHVSQAETCIFPESQSRVVGYSVFLSILVFESSDYHQ